MDKEWETRFVAFGYILLNALTVIARNEKNEDADFAREQLDRFNNMVKKTIKVKKESVNFIDENWLIRTVVHASSDGEKDVK